MSDQQRLRIRNFVIIAHIDHGKSTLADRFLEITGTVPPRKMREQYLDLLELERERGITIKMAPVRMQYGGAVLNLIDTPGHSDFSYEVSRALKAVEGAVLLVDATQGVQAQTLANLEAAREANLTIIGALNKIDLNPDGVDDLAGELAGLISVPSEAIHRISARTGSGVRELLDAVVRDVPPPKSIGGKAALIFSSFYDDHKGIIAFVRNFGGEFRNGERVRLQAGGRDITIKEVGHFAPELSQKDALREGEIGYIATGLKDPDAVRIGDTLGSIALPGFQVPKPVVFVSFYPREADDYDDFKTALQKLRLDDSSLVFTPDTSPVLGRGFKCGFLGRLHFEITVERLEREFGQSVVSSFPSVAYKVSTASGETFVENAKDFPDIVKSVQEPYAKLTILVPARFLGAVLELQRVFRMGNIRAYPSGSRMKIEAEMPLADLILDFDDKLKSASQGYASFSYELIGYRDADVKRLDIAVAGETVPGLSRVVPSQEVYREARRMAKQLKELLPRQQFAQAVQAKVGGDVIARETIPALRKNVTGNLYGGDRTRKMKLWKKQQKGKKRLRERANVEISPEVFRELLKR